MLASTLQQLIDRRHTTVDEIASLAGVSNSTVYRWIGRKSQPDFDAVRRIIRGLPNRRAQEALLAVVTTGTGWRVRAAELSLDINRDGKVDADDALDAAIRVVHDAGRSLMHVRSTCAAGTVRKDDLVDLIALLNHVVEHSTMVQEILIRMVEQKQRQRARPAR